MNEQENKGESHQDQYSGATDAMIALSEAIEQICSSVQEFIKRIKKALDIPEDSEPVEPIIIPDKPDRQIPPRRTSSRARSPAVRRWWINYKARDKLPCKSLKSGGKRKCQRKKSASRMPFLQ